MHLLQHELYTRKTELALERKFHLDFTNTDTAVRALKLARLDFTYPDTAVIALKLARLGVVLTPREGVVAGEPGGAAVVDLYNLGVQYEALDQHPVHGHQEEVVEQSGDEDTGRLMRKSTQAPISS